jgi:squalene cyclase
MNILLSLLLTCTVFAQTEVIVSSVLYSSLSGAVTYNQMMDRELYKKGNLEYKDYSRRWHTMKYFEMASGIGTGFVIALDSKLEADKFIADLLVVGGIRWVVHDGVYNIAQGNPFFYQSKTSYSMIEGVGTWYIKLAFLGTVILIRYLI